MAEFEGDKIIIGGRVWDRVIAENDFGLEWLRKNIGFIFYVAASSWIAAKEDPVVAVVAGYENVSKAMKKPHKMTELDLLRAKRAFEEKDFERYKQELAKRGW